MLLLSAALLLGMQTAPDPAVQIVLKASDEGCNTLVDGAPVDQDGLETRSVEWARSGRTVELSGDGNTPYRCVGGAMFALQKADFRADFGYTFAPNLRIRLSATVKLIVLPRCEISINDRPATFAEYEALAVQWGRNQTEILFQPHPNSAYQCVDRVLVVLKKSNATKLGFIGNEQYVVPEKSE